MDPDVALKTESTLFVDLDGTLIATDLLYESAFELLGQSPLSVLKVPFWMARGKAAVKREIANRVSVDAATLPYREEVIGYIRSQRASGRNVILATASDVRVARQVADHLQLFDDVIGSDGETNLRGATKLNAMQEFSTVEEIAYIGDSEADIPILNTVSEPTLVDPRAGLLDRLEATARARVNVIETGSKTSKKEIIRLLRPHQWSKNMLLFAPIFLAHQMGNVWALMTVAIGFVCLSMLASGTYVLNDLTDIRSDRRHPTKRRRPLASGSVSIPHAMLIAMFLIVGAFGLALCDWPRLPFLLACYLISTLSYSYYLKRKVLMDVLTLTGLYTLRFFIGAELAGVVVSQWLFALSFFLFLSLALVKRYCELSRVVDHESSRNARRGYQVEDIGLVGTIGPCSGLLATLVLMLYVNQHAPEHYTRPELLWAVCPLFLYWIMRVWFFAYRRTLDDDPIVFAIKDKATYAVFGLSLMFVVLAYTL